MVALNQLHEFLSLPETKGLYGDMAQYQNSNHILRVSVKPKTVPFLCDILHKEHQYRLQLCKTLLQRLLFKRYKKVFQSDHISLVENKLN